MSRTLVSVGTGYHRQQKYPDTTTTTIVDLTLTNAKLHENHLVKQ